MFEFLKKTFGEKENYRAENNQEVVKGIDFKASVDLLHSTIESMVQEHEKLRRLPTGDRAEIKEIEHLRAMQVGELRNNISNSLVEAQRLIKIASEQKMSVFTSRLEELNNDKERLKNLEKQVSSVVLSEEYDIAV